MPTMSEISATTTSISIRVTPEFASRPDFPALILPTEDVGIHPISSRRAVGAEADDVGFVSVLARIAINVRMVPGIVLDLFLQIRPLPILDTLGLLAQRLQTLFGSGKSARIEFVGPEGG